MFIVAQKIRAHILRFLVNFFIEIPEIATHRSRVYYSTGSFDLSWQYSRLLDSVIKRLAIQRIHVERVTEIKWAKVVISS